MDCWYTGADGALQPKLDLDPKLGNDSGPKPSRGPTLSDTPSPIVTILKKEGALFTILLFFGLTLLPMAVWLVGKTVFGAYGGAGYADFFGTLSSKIRSGDLVAWFLVLSPYLVWQCVRLTALGWRAAGKM